MPRIYQLDANDESEPVDYCRHCWPNAVQFANPWVDDINADHPPYEETDYLCDECGRELTWADDDAEDKRMPSRALRRSWEGHGN